MSKRERFSWRRAAAILLVAYVISVGPAAKVTELTGWTWIADIYWPITFAAMHFPPFGFLLLLYFAVCGVNLD